MNASNNLGKIMLDNTPHYYNGGVLGQILADTTFSLKNLSLKFSTKFDELNYVLEFYFNRSISIVNISNSFTTHIIINGNYNATVFGIIYIILIVLCLLFVCGWIIFHINRYHHITKYIVNKFETNKGKITITPACQRRTQQQKQLKTNLILSVICFVFLLLISVHLCITVSGIIRLVDSLMYPNINNISSISLSNNNIDSDSYVIFPADQSYNTFRNHLYQSKYHINQFFFKLINTSRIIFYDTLDQMVINLTTSVFDHVRRVTQELLNWLKVPNMFNASKTLINTLNVTTHSMSNINKKSRVMMQDIDIFTGKINAIKSLLLKNMKICCSISNQCQKFRTDIETLRVPIETSKINIQSSIITNFVIEQFKLNLTQLIQNIKSESTKFERQINETSESKIKSINIEEPLNSTKVFWSKLNDTFVPLHSSFTDATQIAESMSHKMGLLFVILLSLLIPSFILIIILYSYALYKLTYRFYLEYIIIKNDLKLTKTNEIHSVLQNYKEKAQLKKQILLWPIRWHYYYFYFIFLSLILLFIAIVALTLTFGSLLIYHESCVQYGSETGFKVVDGLIDRFLNRYWSVIMVAVNGNNSVLPITLSQPKSVLEKLSKYCVKSNGLLYAINMTKIINISSVVWSPENVKLLESGQRDMYNVISSLDVKSIIPNDIKFFLTLANRITYYFDNIDYQESINELSKDIISIPDIDSWIKKATLYFNSVSGTCGNNIINFLNELKLSMQNIQPTKVQIKALRDDYVAIQNNQKSNELIKYIVAITKNITNLDSKLVQKVVETIYTKVMFKEFRKSTETLLSTYLDNMILNIFPCSDLPIAGKYILTGLCRCQNESSSYLTDNIAGVGLNLNIILIMSIILWIIGLFIATSQFQETYETNVATC